MLDIGGEITGNRDGSKRQANGGGNNGQDADSVSVLLARTLNVPTAVDNSNAVAIGVSCSE
jgi:hypothetical protein